MESYLERLQKYLAQIDEGRLLKIASTINSGGTVFIIGNGGSMATAMHFAEDLMHVGIKAVALSDISQITMLANDYEYADIFAKQLEIKMEPGDIVIGISCSGNSPNIVKAIEYANKLGFTIGLTDFDGGTLGNIVQQHIHVPTTLKDFGPAEDAHLVICHIITVMVEEWQ